MAKNAHQQRGLFALPAVRALIVQLLALLMLAIVIWVNSVVFHLAIPIVAAIFLQATFAAVLARFFALAPWWWLIQFLFFPALISVATLHLPSTIYLLAFLLSVFLYWGTFRTQVPFYPSGPKAWRIVEGLLPASHSLRFIDIGSGFGGLVLHLARSRPDSRFFGIELAPLPWLASRLRGWFLRSTGEFLLGDYERVNLGDFDVVFAYLSPAAMPVLWQKARAEMRPGSLLLSYEFDIPGVQSQIANISAINSPILYGWEM